jgi:hypothetical protein
VIDPNRRVLPVMNMKLFIENKVKKLSSKSGFLDNPFKYPANTLPIPTPAPAIDTVATPAAKKRIKNKILFTLTL